MMTLAQIKDSRASVWLVALFCFIALMILTPVIPQSQEYHNFADQRNFFGVPNTLNVISNFPFLIIGVVGLILCLYGNHFSLSFQGEVWGWVFFYIGVTATAFGSAYYHLKPDDARLVWDRLPMTIAFTSIMAVFIIERIDEKTGTMSLFPLLMAGVVSIAYWRYFDDLRPYALVQFIPCIAIPAMTILLPAMYTHSIYWLWAADAWWTSYGGRVPHLQKLAIRVLNQTCGSSGCERNWSVFDKIHSKKRNKLESQRLNDMVYVYYSLRLWVRQLQKTPDVEAISLDNIDTIVAWRVDTERLTMDSILDWLDVDLEALVVEEEVVAGEREPEVEEEEHGQGAEQEEDEEEVTPSSMGSSNRG